MTEIIRDMEGIRKAVRRRRDELNISHETIDQIAGLQSGYTSKLLAPKPLKNFGDMSFGAVLGALAIGIVVVEDPDQKGLVEGRWQPRKRPMKLPLLASALSIDNEVPAVLQITAEVQREMRKKRMQELGSIGGKKGGSKGGKRRLKTMGKRARQRAATHAARIRWSKDKRV